MKMKQVILGLMTEDVELGHKRPATITFTMVEKVLMVVGELDIGLRPSPLPTIIQAIWVYGWNFMLMIMIEVDIYLIPVTITNITMVNYSLSSQGPLKKLLQGVCEEKILKIFIKDMTYIHIKIILIIIHIQELHHNLIQACHHFLLKHATTPYLVVSILYFYPYLCT